MDTITLTNSNFLYILQLASPALPVGAYSYSEGLETLIENSTIATKENLKHWLAMELCYGTIRLEAAVMVRAYQSMKENDLKTLSDWNFWLSAARETEELRASSVGMGRSLMRLLVDLQPQLATIGSAIGNYCNYAIAFGVASAFWQINMEAAVLGYLHNWVSNLITTGVKLIPLGQTAGQQLLMELQLLLSTTTVEILGLEDDELSCCSWGLSLASMRHETLYTRLFRS
ncbi:urease accessory protein UreF [Chlorogloeopsis sp. ULAP01]|uniref:urease accessory protein UreF n=1 Tax=Chlorogloeopsis sp. ULAP01 TaxID=3056483 RepID=UPI0025AB149D|nr:urease accessory protein UreF [Chlorogloeopsis sp. ULAP01]MDM9385141.1 urease accessory protein UreF [Chlorogloeopsis sp. ULAP01]